MNSVKRPGLGPILLTVFLDLLGFGLVIPLLPFYAESLSASPAQVGVLMGVYSLGQFLGAPLWGGLSDTYGRRPVLLVSIGVTVVFLALFASAGSYEAAVLYRALHGLGAANLGTAQAYIADVTEGKDRARGMGLFGAMFGIGFSVGPFVGGFLAGDEAAPDLTRPIWFAAALAAINFVWVAARLPESRTAEARLRGAAHARSANPLALVQSLAHPVVGLAIALLAVATFAFAMMESSFGLVAEHVWGYSPREVGVLFGVIGSIAVVVQGGLVGRLAPRVGEPRLVMVGYTLNGLAFVGLGQAETTGAVYAACAVLALGNSLATPSLNALISKGTSADEQGVVLGSAQSLASLARTVAPPVGGLLFEGLFPQAPMFAGAVVILGVLALSLPALSRARPAASGSAPSSPG